jgi:hypothetical protein
MTECDVCRQLAADLAVSLTTIDQLRAQLEALSPSIQRRSSPEGDSPALRAARGQVEQELAHVSQLTARIEALENELDRLRGPDHRPEYLPTWSDYQKREAAKWKRVLQQRPQRERALLPVLHAIVEQLQAAA